MNTLSLQEKEYLIKDFFSPLTTTEQRYHGLIEWGKKLPAFDENDKKPEFLVSGCQSIMYVNVQEDEKKLFFSAHSDALISAGLASLLIFFYNGESAQVILTCPPHFFEELGIKESLTPGRANGLASLYLKMKQLALKSLISKKAVLNG